MGINALDQCFTDCEAYFAARAWTDVLKWGRAELTKQTNVSPASRANRIVLVPGDDAGKAGKLGAPRAIGSGRPKAIYGWAEQATIHVWGRDPMAAKEDERAHYRIACDLFEKFLRAVRNSQCGMIEMGEPVWVTKPVELVFGAALTFPLIVHGQIQEAMPAVVRATAQGIDSSTFQQPNSSFET
jgi:hypothetical protein